MKKIKVIKNGPYIVEGYESAVEYSSGETIPLKDGSSLCRCGKSSQKPFCDGTHIKVGFSDKKDPKHVANKRDNYVGKDITIHDNRGICAHAGRCTDGLKDTFRLGVEPFIDVEASEAKAIAKVIDTCPSGALSYTLKGNTEHIRGGNSSLAVAPNGPFVFSGGVDELNSELLEGATLDHLTLCRCGQSTNKPFCSGAHWNVQFDEKVTQKK